MNKSVSKFDPKKVKIFELVNKDDAEDVKYCLNDGNTGEQSWYGDFEEAKIDAKKLIKANRKYS